MENGMEIEKEAKILSGLIVRELVSRYQKEIDEAKEMVRGMNLINLILDEPLRLHESPEKWAVIVLTFYDDIDALERYYLR